MDIERNLSVIKNPKIEEEIDRTIDLWLSPITGEIKLKDAKPAKVEEIFSAFDEKSKEISKKDNAPELDSKALEKEAQKQFNIEWKYKKLPSAMLARRLDSIRSRLRKEQITSGQLIRDLEKNPSDALNVTNNFYMAFDPKLAEGISKGEAINPLKINYALLPYYINEKYNNAWSQMCQDLTEEVKTVMKYTFLKRPEELKDITQKALTKITKYLYDRSGISIYFLRP